METQDLPECPLHGSHAMNYTTGVCQKCLELTSSGPMGSHRTYNPDTDTVAALEDKPGYPSATTRPDLPSFGGVPLDTAKLTSPLLKEELSSLEPADIILRLLNNPNPLCTEAAGVISRLRTALRAAIAKGA